MGEIKRAVQTVEVNYVCDKCEHGMMQSCGDTDPATYETPHKCMICGHLQSFKGVTYPRIDYVGEGESF
jgi:transcription elongation factor Elf1